MAKLNLKKKIIITVSALFVVFFTATALITFSYFKNQLRDIIAQQQSTLISKIAEELDEKIEAAHIQIIELSKTLPADIIAQPDKAQAVLDRRVELKSTFNNGIFLFSGNGKMIAETPFIPDRRGKDYSHREYFKKTINIGKPHISNPYFSSQTHQHPAINFTAPIFNRKGEIVAVLAGSIDLMRHNFLGNIRNIKIGKTGYLYIYNTERTMIMHPDAKRILKQDVPPGVNKLFDKAIEGFEGTGDTINSRGVPMLTSFKRLKSTNWILAANYIATEAYAPIYKAQRYAIIGTIIGIIVIISAIWFFLNYLTASLALITKHVEDLPNKRGEGRKIPISNEDEFGNLSQAFNNMLDEIDRHTEALEKSEELFSKAFHSSPSWTMINTLDDGKFIDVNHAFGKMTGYSHDEVVGKTTKDILLWAHKQELKDFIRLVVENGNIRDFEVQFRIKSGEIRIMLLAADLFYLQKTRCVLTTAHDITELKKSQEIRSLLTEILEATSDIVVTPDINGNISYINSAGRKMLGFGEEEDVSGIKAVCIHPDWTRKQIMEQALPHAVKHGNWSGETFVLNKDKKEIPVSQVIIAHRTALGKIDFISTIMRDITQQKAVETELRRQSAYLAALHEITLSLISRLNLGELLEAIITRAGFLAGSTHGFIYFLEGNSGTMKMRVGTGFFSKLVGFEIKKGEGLAGTVWQTGEVVVINDYSTWPGRLSFSSLNELRAIIGVPLISGAKVAGVIGLAHLDETKKFSQEDISVLKLFARLASVALDNAMLYENVQLELAERKRAETQIRKLFRAVEQSPAAVMITDTEGNIEYVNPRFTEVTDYTFDEVVGKNPRILKSGETPSEEYKNMWNIITSGGEWRGEFHNRKKSGELYWEMASISPVKSPEGVITHFIAAKEDITEQKQRMREMEAVVALSIAMRTAQNRTEMLPIILEQILGLLNAEGAALGMRDGSGDEIVMELARGEWTDWTGIRLSESAGVSGHVISAGTPYLSNNIKDDPLFALPHIIGDLCCAACVPLIAHKQIVGILWIGRKKELNTNDLRILTAIGDIAANAIHRATLHEQTEQRMRRLVALHDIDLAIASNLNLELTLDVLLEEIATQLGVDAADVLLFYPETETLEYAAGRGFSLEHHKQGRLKLGESYAGIAALNKSTVGIPNLTSAANISGREKLLLDESFVAYYAAPLIAKGKIKGVLEILNRSPLRADKEWLDFLESLALQTAIAVENAVLLEDLQRSNLELALAYDATLEGWSRALDLRDKETEGHTQRVAEMTVRLARVMGICEAKLEHIRRGALLHDIGKMGIPDNILLKPAALNEEELEIMRRHAKYAHEMLSPIAHLKPALEIPYCHHERWDGTGYPQGLKGEAIPLPARIFAVVDVWDALRSDRPYRKAWTEEAVREYIKSHAGTHFDPQVVEAFLTLIVGDAGVRC